MTGPVAAFAFSLALAASAFGVEAPELRPDVPPGVAEDDPDRARFRLGQDPLRSFEGDAEGWGIETWPDPAKAGVGEPTIVPAELTTRDATHGAQSLVIPLELPRPAVVVKRSRLGEFRYISYDVFIPADAPGRIRSLFFVKNKDGLWFQKLSARPYLQWPKDRHTSMAITPSRGRSATMRPGRSETRLVAGRWNTITVDLREGSDDLRPEGSLARWQERFAVESEVLGFAVFGEKPFTGEAYLDNVRGWELDGSRPRPLLVRNLALPPGPVGRYERFEATFELTRHFANPFDPREVSVHGVFTTPAGDVVRVPGFIYQEYMRRLTPAGEDLRPVGAAVWKVRYAPMETGRHAFRLTVVAGGGTFDKLGAAVPSPSRGGGEKGDGGDRLVTRDRAFDVVPSDSPGFVRVSRRDPRCFEFDNGRPFFPIGHNVRSPNDPRCSFVLGWPVSPDEGTYTYDRILERRAAGGENFIEIWMASWWVGLEWTYKWKGYHGLGRYNLANAWRHDHVLEKARGHGVRVQLVIDNHVKYSAHVDPEWKHSPYNIRQRTPAGFPKGFLRTPNEFFTNPEAKRYYRRKARSIFARWGAETTVSGFEMISELNLTGQRGGFAGRKRHLEREGAPLRVDHLWHREMIEYYRTVDPARHLYTTHYSGRYDTVDPMMARLPEIDYVVGDGYRGGDRPFAELARQTAVCQEEFGKPFMVTEYGGDWRGTSEAGLEADLHCGIWSSWMTSAGGTPLLWWFDFIDRRDLYWHFKAFAAYTRGEDRRDPAFRMTRPAVEHAGGGRLGAMAYMSRRRGYAWVYAVEAMTRYPKEPMAVENVRLRFTDVEPGVWKVEFWDTVTGEIAASRMLDTEGGMLAVDLPAFTNDMAVKLARTRRLRDVMSRRRRTRGARGVRRVR